MRHIFSDIRFAFRLMRRGPAFYATLIAILVAGIGATTAMFSIVESFLLRPLPYPHPEELTMVWRADARVNPGPSSIPDFLDLEAQATSFQYVSATAYTGISLSSTGARPEPLQGAYVSGGFFPMLGIRALQGRLLGPEDDRVGGPRVAVLSAAVWHRRFGSDPALVGRTVTLNSNPYTVVGIAEEGFAFSGPFADRTDVWTPFAATYEKYSEASKQRGDHFIHVMGRRKPGVTLDAAQAQTTAICRSLEALYPDTNTKKTMRVGDLHEELVGGSAAGVWVLFAAVALVFLIVCANVANLLLSRAQSRRAEMAARAALGATPGRLAAQIVTETVTVFLLASAFGSLVSRWLVDAFAAGIVDGGAARTIPVRVDVVALAFSAGMCLVCGVVFGLVPALAVARVEPQAVLKESAAGAGVGRSQRTVRGALVVSQVAIAVALLVGSALTLKAFMKTASTSPGFDPTDLATARVVLPASKYATDESAAAFYREVIARIAARPDVVSVAANDTLPMAGSNSSGSFDIQGRPSWPKGEQPNLGRNVVTPGYFATMRTPILRGREFTDTDVAGGRLVMVINETTAKTFFPGEDPIGKFIDWGEDDDTHNWREIVGIAGDVRHRGLDKPVDAEAFVPLAQHGSRWMVIVARSPHAAALLREIPRIVESVDAQEAVAHWSLMVDRVASTIRNARYVAMLLGAFALAALLLATLGIFGLVSYSTSQRTRELGIRMALGSTPEAVVGLVMRGGVRLLGAGIVVGLAGAVLVGRVLASRVYGVHAFDPAIYAAIPAILGLTGVLASLVPAWRAVRIPPASALRYE